MLGGKKQVNSLEKKQEYFFSTNPFRVNDAKGTRLLHTGTTSCAAKARVLKREENKHYDDGRSAAPQAQWERVPPPPTKKKISLWLIQSQGILPKFKAGD